MAQEVGLRYTALSKTIECFSASRLASLAPRTRGRRSGAGLSVEQEQAIARTIRDQRR